MVKKYTNLIPCSEDDKFTLEAIRTHVRFHEQWGIMKPESRLLFVEDAIEYVKGGELYEQTKSS